MSEQNQGRRLLMPTAYLPPVSYMAWLSVADEIEIEIHETYSKQTWRNRCTIASANGPLNLSIPVEKPLGNHTPTNLIRASNHTQWKRQHWKSIESAYRKSAYFIHYSDVLEPYYATNLNDSLLVEWNMALLQSLCKAIGLEKKISYTSTFIKNPEGIFDLRDALSSKSANQTQLPEDVQINYFQSFSEKYGFLPNLSIIDALFHLGPETLQYIGSCGVRQLNFLSKQNLSG